MKQLSQVELLWRGRDEEPSLLVENPPIFVTDPIAWSERRKRELGPS
jgi:hypothetical protein